MIPNCGENLFQNPNKFLSKFQNCEFLRFRIRNKICQNFLRNLLNDQFPSRFGLILTNYGQIFLKMIEIWQIFLKFCPPFPLTTWLGIPVVKGQQLVLIPQKGSPP